MNGHHGQGSDGKKIVQNSKDGQWPSVSGDMCPRPVSQAVWLHWHAKNPQKQFLRPLTAAVGQTAGQTTSGRTPTNPAWNDLQKSGNTCG